jgi:elongation factor P
MQHAALAVPKRAGELHDAALACGQQLLAGEFGGRSQVEPLAPIRRRDKIACKSMEMGLVPRRANQRTGFNFDKIPGGEELPQSGGDAHAPQKKRPAVQMTSPERRWHGVALPQPARGRAGSRENRWRMVARSVWCGPTFGPHRHRARPPGNRRKLTVKVIASSLRKGNIVELDNKLYVDLNAESFHPGKGTPTTQVDMRRISDGVKVAQRYKTTEQVERAHVEDREHQFLYQDADGFHFMNMENYDQVTLPSDIIGDQAVYLEPEMKVMLAVHENVPVSIELPQKAILEVVETEPTMKGQTASSSYKPAVLSNGVRTMVPPFVGTGTKIVVMTADGSYVERAKD